eukprot:539025_1
MSDNPTASLQIVYRTIGGIGWTIAYVLAIYTGFIQNTYCIPGISVIVNFSWESYFSIHKNNSTMQWYMNIVWVMLDLVIVCQFLCYGEEYFKLPRVLFYPICISWFIISYRLIAYGAETLKDARGRWSGFIDNYFMSVLFVFSFYQNDSLKGQSVSIAIFKFIGSLFMVIYAWSVNERHFVMVYLYVNIIIFDVFYIYLLVTKTS